ncbi:hypothetical protein ACFWJU_00360 [Streptomyces mutabilis]|uniref:hypothetical protein n=1 Tax=Streptomyces mutabilis TaxID=67332 RepID=UPI00364DA853
METGESFEDAVIRELAEDRLAADRRKLVIENNQGPVSDGSKTGPDLRLSPVGTTGFEPATP